jgi:hypothetical protein
VSIVPVFSRSRQAGHHNTERTKAQVKEEQQEVELEEAQHEG